MFGLHRGRDMHPARLRQQAKIKLDDRLVRIWDIELIKLGLISDVRRFKAFVTDIRNHRIRNVPDTSKPCSLKRKLGRGNVHAHTTHNNGDYFFFSES